MRTVAAVMAVIHNVICYGNKLLQLFSEWQLVRSFEIKLVGPFVVAYSQGEVGGGGGGGGCTSGLINVYN